MVEWRELPYLDSPIEASAYNLLAIGRESNTVHRIPMFVGIFEAYNQIALHVVLHVPDEDSLIQRPGCNQLAIGGNSDRCNAILNRECQNTDTVLDVPQTNSPVTATRCYRAAVARKVYTIDLLLMAGKDDADGAGRDVPDLADVSKEVADIVTP